MTITNEILFDIIHCQHKAYRIINGDKRTTTEYNDLFTTIKNTYISNYETQILESNKLKINGTTIDKVITKGIATNTLLAYENISIVFDAIEFITPKTIIPILFIPSEKISIMDKLFLSLQASYLQAKYKIEYCRIIYGKEFKRVKFRTDKFSIFVKRIISEIENLLSNNKAPSISRNTHCSICEFQTECIQKLKDRDDLSLLSGLKPKEISNYNNRGIFSVKQLSYKYRPRKSLYRKRNYLPELKALAIRENKTFVREMPNIKTAENEIYLDIEGLPDRYFTYLIGVVVKKGDSIKTYSFWADSEKDENEIYIKFIELLKPLADYTVYHYGSYETKELKRISKCIKQEYCEDIASIIRNSFNLLNIFSANIYPPTYSNGLKEIALFMGFKWTEQSASGIQSIIWRNRWELSKDTTIKSKLIIYNRDDCTALLKVKEWIMDIPNRCDKDKIVNADDIKIDGINKWKNNDFLIKAFDKINRFAYFDYQREKVYVKTHPRKIYCKPSINKTKKTLKPNFVIVVQKPKRCEKCNSKKVSNYDIIHRVVTDLKLLSSTTKCNTSDFEG